MDPIGSPGHFGRIHWAEVSSPDPSSGRSNVHHFTSPIIPASRDVSRDASLLSKDEGLNGPCLRSAKRSATHEGSSLESYLLSLRQGNVFMVEVRENTRKLHATFGVLRGGLWRCQALIILVFIPLFLCEMLAMHTFAPEGGRTAVRLHIFASLSELLLVFLLALYVVVAIERGDGKLRGSFLRSRDPLAQSMLSLFVLLLSALLSLSSPAQRCGLLGLRPASFENLEEETRPGPDAAALWIALAHAFVAVFGLLPVEVFLPLSQFTCLQHVALNLIFPCRHDETSGNGWERLGLSAASRSGLQLSFLAGLLAVAAYRVDGDLRLRKAADHISQADGHKSMDKHESTVFVDGTSTDSPPTPGPPKESALTELLRNEVSLQRLLLELAESAPLLDSSVAWLNAVSHVLQMNHRAYVKLHVDMRQSKRSRTRSSSCYRLVANRLSDVSRQVSEAGGEGHTGKIDQFLLQTFMETELDVLAEQSQLQQLAEESASGEAIRASIRPGEIAKDPFFGQWEFNALAIEAEHGRTLQQVGYEYLCKFPILPKEVVAEFLENLENGYNKDNDYHMHVHAAEVCNASVVLASSVGLWDTTFLSDSSKISLLLASMGHDLAHFGRTNHFVITTGHSLAIRYNDRSVLENFHCASLFELLNGNSPGRMASFPWPARSTSREELPAPKRLLLGGLRTETRLKMRQLVISLILSTDTQYHLESVTEFSIQLDVLEASLLDEWSTPGSEEERHVFDPVREPKDQQQALCVLFRAADIGHSAKPWKQHEEWAQRITSEFHKQGDEEQALGLPLSPLCDRTNFVLSVAQVGFLQFVCIPTWMQMGRLETLVHSLLCRGRTMREDEMSVDLGRAIKDKVILQCDENLKAWQAENAMKKSQSVNSQNQSRVISASPSPVSPLTTMMAETATSLPGCCDLEVQSSELDLEGIVPG
eukprot:TRINITY_DN14354_c0_g1_i2.p1 TRINITY_DN14354_c0_g1~~TRINITY_DN14354_c0_g1_i2.p1  ORF type:complete len:955 (-),score=190.30 TRINITY_DN14354_c0_g1_i2:97-2904(-)